MRAWNHDVFGNIFSRVKPTKDTFKLREVEFDSNKDEHSKVRLHEALASFFRELALECAYWHKKAGIKWFKKGDANTAFFHGVLKQRRNTNFIS